MMKKLTALFAAIAAALSLTACSNNESGKQYDENSVHDDNTGNTETVKNKSVTIPIGEENWNVIYSGEWADGMPNGHGKHYDVRENMIGLFVGEFTNGESSGYAEAISYYFPQGYSLFIGENHNGNFNSDYYYEEKGENSSCYKICSGKDVTSYSVSNGVVKDETNDKTLTGAEADEILAKAKDHFGYSEIYYRLRGELDEYIKENNLDFGNSD